MPYVAVRYLSNLEGDMGSATFRSISTASPFFASRLKPFPSAVKLLAAAGFKPVDDPKTGVADDRLKTSNSYRGPCAGSTWPSCYTAFFVP